MEDRIKEIFNESIEVKQKALEANITILAEAANKIKECLKEGKKILIFGNGGSAADSQHIAAEFIGRFQKERQALPAIALTTDTSILTALINDYGNGIVFARQVEGLGQSGDIAIGISTSGNSSNVIEGLKKAKELGLTTMALTGRDGGEMGPLADIHLNVPSETTARIQEVHICMAHCLCELAEADC